MAPPPGGRREGGAFFPSAFRSFEIGHQREHQVIEQPVFGDAESGTDSLDFLHDLGVVVVVEAAQVRKVLANAGGGKHILGFGHAKVDGAAHRADHVRAAFRLLAAPLMR